MMWLNVLKGIRHAATAGTQKRNFVIDPLRSLITYYMSPILPAVYRLFKEDDNAATLPLPVSEDFFNEKGQESDLLLDHEGPEPKTAFLFFHGFSDTAHTCLPIGLDLHKRGYVVSAPRIEGHGLMSYSQIPDSGLGLKMLNGAYDNYKALAARKDIEKIHLVGFSMGGALSICLARRLIARKADQKLEKMFLLAPAIYHNDFTNKLIEYLGELYTAAPWLPFPRVAGDRSDQDFSLYNYGYSCINGSITLGLNFLMTLAETKLGEMKHDIHMIIPDSDQTLSSLRWDDVFEKISSKTKTVDVIKNSGHNVITAPVITRDNKKQVLTLDYILKYLD